MVKESIHEDSENGKVLNTHLITDRILHSRTPNSVPRTKVTNSYACSCRKMEKLGILLRSLMSRALSTMIPKRSSKAHNMNTAMAVATIPRSMRLFIDNDFISYSPDQTWFLNI